MPVGEVEVRERVGLRLFQELGGLRVETGDLLAGQVVQLAHERGVLLGEDGVQYGAYGGLVALALRAWRRVSLQVNDAALPGGAGEDLLYRLPEPFVGVARDAHDAVDAAGRKPLHPRYDSVSMASRPTRRR